MRSLARRCVATCLLALFLAQTTGCTSWRVASQPFPDSAQVARAREVRVTTPAGAKFRMDSVTVVDDALAGRISNGDGRGTWTRVAREDIESLELRLSDTGKTLGLVIPVVLLVGAVIAAGAALDNMTLFENWGS